MRHNRRTDIKSAARKKFFDAIAVTIQRVIIDGPTSNPPHEKNFFDAIAATIQRVIIDGHDTKSAARKKFFDKYLNYPEANGMLSSEFIYKTIADKFKEVSK